MAISRVQSKSGSDTDAATLAITLDDTLSANDRVVVTIAGTTATAVSSVVGNNNIGNLFRVGSRTVTGIEGGGVILQRWVSRRAPNTPSFPTITITFDQAGDVAAIVEVFRSTRVFPFNPIDQQASDGGNNKTTISTGTTPETIEDNEAWHAGWCWFGSSDISGSPTNSFVNVVNVAAGTTLRLITAHKIVTATGQAESTATIDGAATDAAGMVHTYREEPDVGEPPSSLEVDIIPEWYLMNKKGR